MTTPSGTMTASTCLGAPSISCSPTETISWPVLLSIASNMVEQSCFSSPAGAFASLAGGAALASLAAAGSFFGATVILSQSLTHCVDFLASLAASLAPGGAPGAAGAARGG